jgi:2-keto-4-pentenoate hydratase/2-oxohepta-3-ene-1,7-dioic acid hydratase in catechol pathway
MRIARALIGDQPVFGDLDNGHFHVLEGDVFDSPARTGETHALDDLNLLSPIDPGRILLILGGFMPKDGSALPPGTVPRFAVKVVSSVSGDGGEIVVPAFVSTPLWIEVELAAVIGRTLRNADPEEADAGIWGFTCFNDASAPEFIFDLEAGKGLDRPDYFRCKSIETFASMGPCVRTDLTEAAICDGVRLTTHVNGELRGEGNTERQKFPPSVVVSYVTQQTTLYRGDVIALGTPQPALASPGDDVELAAEGIGSFRNRISAAPA